MHRLIVATLLFGTLTACQAPPSSTVNPSSPALTSNAPTSERYTLTEPEKDRVRQGIKKTLKDPESAQFSEAFAAAKDSKGVVTVCGYVNARNSFGGYTGAQPFIGILTDSGFGVGGFGSDNTMRRIILSQCNRHGVI